MNQAPTLRSLIDNSSSNLVAFAEAAKDKFPLPEGFDSFAKGEAPLLVHKYSDLIHAMLDTPNLRGVIRVLRYQLSDLLLRHTREDVEATPTLPLQSPDDVAFPTVERLKSAIEAQQKRLIQQQQKQLLQELLAEEKSRLSKYPFLKNGYGVLHDTSNGILGIQEGEAGEIVDTLTIQSGDMVTHPFLQRPLGYITGVYTCPETHEQRIFTVSNHGEIIPGERVQSAVMKRQKCVFFTELERFGAKQKLYAENGITLEGYNFQHHDYDKLGSLVVYHDMSHDNGNIHIQSLGNPNHACYFPASAAIDNLGAAGFIVDATWYKNHTVPIGVSVSWTEKLFGDKRTLSLPDLAKHWHSQ